MKTRITLLVGLGLTLCSAPVAPANQATFRVNMSVQTAMNLFDPANDFMFVAGTFNEWSTTASQLTQSPTNSDIYEGTFEVGAAGTWPNYKFVKNRYVGGVQWEVNGVGEGGARDRYFQVPTNDPYVLDVAYFNNLSNVIVNVTPVTFQVNMSVQAAQGSFDPLSGTVTVAGDAINNWDNANAPCTLAQSLTDTNLWVGTFNITNPVGSSVFYKYLMNGTWESVGDRSFTLAEGAQTLPPVYFNNVTNIAVPIPLTFQVNLGVAIARGNFNPDTDYVEARGSFFTGTGGTWLGGFILSNSVGNPLVYSGTWVDTNDAPGSVIQYQFVLIGAGETWEDTGNRQFTPESTNAVVLPLAFFENVADLGSVTGAVAAGQMELSWLGGPRVRLQSATDLASGWQDVPDTAGLSATTLPLATGARFFRVVGP